VHWRCDIGLNKELTLFHRYESEGKFYFSPNGFAESGYQPRYSTVIDGTKPLAVATHQRVGKGVLTAKRVEFFFRTHWNENFSPVQSVTLSFDDSNVQEEFNLLTNDPYWATAQIPCFRKDLASYIKS